MTENKAVLQAEASNYRTWKSVTKGYGRSFALWLKREYGTLKSAKEDFIEFGFEDEEMPDFLYNTFQNSLRDVSD